MTFGALRAAVPGVASAVAEKACLALVALTANPITSVSAFLALDWEERAFEGIFARLCLFDDIWLVVFAIFVLDCTLQAVVACGALIGRSGHI